MTRAYPPRLALWRPVVVTTTKAAVVRIPRNPTHPVPLLWVHPPPAILCLPPQALLPPPPQPPLPPQRGARLVTPHFKRAPTSVNGTAGSLREERGGPGLMHGREAYCVTAWPATAYILFLATLASLLERRSMRARGRRGDRYERAQHILRRAPSPTHHPSLAEGPGRGGGRDERAPGGVTVCRASKQCSQRNLL